MQVVGKEIVAAEGKYIARKGTENYFRRCTLLQGETEDNFVEVDTMPAPELTIAKETKKKEIEAYDKSDAVNQFTLSGKGMWLPKETRVGLVNSINIERAAGKSKTVLWFDGVRYEIPIELALQMLAALELYALECYNVTHKNLAAIDDLLSADEVEAYNYMTGYPEKLNFDSKEILCLD